MSVALRDRRKKDFRWFKPSAVAALEDGTQVAVYVALLILSGEGSLVFASHHTIASTAKVSDRTVARTLPELERLRVIRRASNDVIAKLADRIQAWPGVIVYELLDVEQMDEPEPEPEDTRPLLLKVQDCGSANLASRRALAVRVIRAELSKQLRRNIDFGWLIRLYNNSARQFGPDLGECRLVEAAEATIKANPSGEPLAYMTRVLSEALRKPQEGTEAVADLGNESAEVFGGWE